jgi:cytochrome c biogenesis protein CcdA
MFSLLLAFYAAGLTSPVLFAMSLTHLQAKQRKNATVAAKVIAPKPEVRKQ